MPRNVYALLVGIDDYPAPVRSLRGCVNDIQQIEAVLDARVKASGDTLKQKVLTNAAATRSAIIDGFRQHLSQAGANDVALFYYSGHGSQQKSPPAFWHLEPDRLDETLVCYDSRQPGCYDLADKELAQLIHEIAAAKAHISIILDCCHSGSGTRNADVTSIRRVPTDDRERPLTSFLSGFKVPPARSAENESGWISLPKGRHILLAACRSDEEAKECSLGGKPRGVFSHFLTETLQQTSGVITYRELFKRVNALVRSHAALQSPQIEPTDHTMFDETFLGGFASAQGRYFTLAHEAETGWVVDAGTVHGIPEPTSAGETALFAIFPQTNKPEQWRDMKQALGTASARRIEPHRSVVEVTFSNGALEENQVYKAVLAAMPLAPLEVHFAGDAAGLALARDALTKAGATGGPSLLVRESQCENAELRLLAVVDGGCYRFLRPADGRQLIGDVEEFTAESAHTAIEHLEHIARWMRIAELRHPGSALAEKVRMEIYTVPPAQALGVKPVEGSELHRCYEWREGKWRRPVIGIKLTNDSDEDLWFALADLTQVFGVQTDLLPGGSVLLRKGESTWANAGKAIHPEVPDVLWRHGIVEVRDVLKLIVSTAQIDATLLQQGDLDHPILRGGAVGPRPLGIKSTLNRLLDRVQTRALSTTPDEDEALADWTTKEMSFTTRRPFESIPVPKASSADLYPGVKLFSHPTLDAKARLTAAPLASRDVAGGLVLPPLLRDDPEVSQPFLLSSSRGGEPGLSVLELLDVRNYQSVTSEQPLRLQIQQPLATGEHLLPITHDGEFFLPIGRAVAKGDHIEVVLDALPQPQNTRSLFSAIRIYFQKIVSQHLGTQYKYPLLAAFDPVAASDHQVTEDPDAVKAKVAEANRVVLYIHGIIGETRGMATSSVGLAGPPKVRGLRDRYDLILTFDYENLQTSIEENARLLKQRLTDAGFRPGHGKTLHIVAHSMGGLVSRWFVEREGGSEIVQRLVMLGTPNGGSPWSTVEDWAITALSLGLNALTPLAWPAKILGSLVAAVEKIDVALDEMHPSSDFLNNLHSSPDPKIPYTVIAGNTSLIARSNPAKDRARNNLLERLKSLNLLHLATAPAFFGEPNDIAVSVANIRRQPPGRIPSATVREVACDHLTYFSTDAGLKALAELLP
jgi:pimeloyl-ACP methyl ester carboxylesterase